MKKIILDTNFLLVPFQFYIDIFSEFQRICDFKYSVYILDKTIDELKKIVKEQKGKHKQAANLALKFIKIKKIKQIHTQDGNVDDLLLEQDAIIATQDAALIRKLKQKKKQIIQLRQKKYLILK